MSLIKINTINETTAVLTLNRLEKKNALNKEMMLDIRQAVDDLESKGTVKSIIITGINEFFAAGMDIVSVQNMDSDQAALEDFINEDWFKLSNTNIITISAVSGYALGGGFELALMCDVMLLNRNAILGFPEIKLGLIPGMGGTQKLAHLIGMKNAFKMIVAGEIKQADEMMKLGLVNELFDDPIEKALEFSKILSNSPKTSLIAIKKAFRKLQSKMYDMEFERELFRGLFSSNNKAEGINAFLQKVTPNFD